VADGGVHDGADVGLLGVGGWGVVVEDLEGWCVCGGGEGGGEVVGEVVEKKKNDPPPNSTPLSFALTSFTARHRFARLVQRQPLFLTSNRMPARRPMSLRRKPDATISRSLAPCAGSAFATQRTGWNEDDMTDESTGVVPSSAMV
jgi:hypothetical protein